MKNLIFAIIEKHTISEEVLESLSKAGYNGTVVPSTSLKHAILDHGEAPMFFNLSHLDEESFENNTTLFIVVDEEKTENVLNIIREHTKNFTLSHGGMFVTPLTSFEGSF